MTGFWIESLDSRHDRTSFKSASEPLDVYLRQQASQDMRRRVATCFVAVPAEAPTTIAGFYTLSAASVVLDELPDPVRKKLPRYGVVPVARMGRLAVDAAFQGRRLGQALLWDACVRAAASDVAVYALTVDAKDERAAGFYAHHGFISLGGDPLRLFVPLTTVLAARPET